jgi:peptidoglycan/LPS O-acetylase OafA/YrhL
MIKYRHDIDSLRGYAVLAVVLYHFKIPLFKGGFIGVDIFFVISGYLITSILFNEMINNNFSFINFYERRIRRIIPILFFVLLVTALIQNKLFLYDEKIDFYKIVLSIIFFVSNFWFAQSGSYFEPDVNSSHLLHTWSLSIEEQFYLIFPLFLFCIYKRKVLLILICLFFLSFLLANNGGILKKTFPYFDGFALIKLPENSFYLLPTRIWELLAGSIIAITKLKSNKFEKKIKIKKNILNIIGYFLIFSSFIFFSDQISHPSIFTLIPIIGISIILFIKVEKKNQTWLEKILSNNLIRYVGLISYSLYLWHLPIMYFYLDYFGPKKLEITEIVLLISISIILSILSYNFIEKVFRRKIIFKKGKTLFYFLILTFVIACFSFYKINYYDFKKDYPSNINKIVEEKLYYKNKFFQDCLSDPKKYISPKRSCVLGDGDNIKYAFIGDSHMGIISQELDNILRDDNVGGYQLTYNGCLPSNELKIRGQSRYKCQKYYNEVINFLKNEKKIETVVLFYRWELYYNGKRFNNQEGGVEKGKDHISVRLDEDKDKILSIEDLNYSLFNFFNKIHNQNKKIVVIKSTPEMGWEIPSLLAKKLMNHDKISKNFLSIDRQLYKKRNFLFNSFLFDMEDDFNLHIYDPDNLFCDQTRCFAFENNYPLYYDDDHLSSSGAKKLSLNLMNFIKKKGM